MKKHSGLIALIVVAMIWGSGFVVSDIALRGLQPFTIMVFRFGIAAAVMSAFAIKELKRLKIKEVLSGAILGGILYIAFAVQTIGLSYTTPSKNAFLTAINVLIVPFLAFIFLKKKVDKFSVAGALFALGGIGLLSLQGSLSISRGDILSILCAVFFAMQIFLTSIYTKEIDTKALTAIQLNFAFLFSVIAYLFVPEKGTIFTTSNMGSVIYLGVCSTCLCYFLQTWAQKKTDETTTAVVLSMEALFGTIFSIIILKEQITIRMFFGCILILFGVILSETKLQFIRRNKLEMISLLKNVWKLLI